LKRPLRLVALALLLLLFGLDHASFADCPEGQMLRVATSFTTTGVAGLPKVIYRLGTEYARAEEAADPEQGLHLLIVVDEPDIWFVNLHDKTGRHIVDPGPTFEFHAPLLPSHTSEHWRRLELGAELRFMREVEAKRTQASPDGPVIYEHSAEGTTVRLHTSAADVPLELQVQAPDANFSVNFLSYECLPPDLSLFAKPTGIELIETP
jgi:hypothetical protein